MSLFFFLNSYYFGLKFGIGALSLIGLSPLVRHLGLSEGVTCCAGLVSKLAGLVLHGFATTTAMMMIVPFVSMLNTFCLPSIRSLLSKQVEPNELGNPIYFANIFYLKFFSYQSFMSKYLR